MTISYNANESLWVEKYRPPNVTECILKPKVKKDMKAIVEDGVIPNMMFTGGPGSGKTTLARALCQELDTDWIIINTSNERGIDTLRDKITSFASTISLGDSEQKCVILDEFDGAGPVLQSAMRNATEVFSANCSFILTANYPNKIIDALHSRFPTVDFNADPKELVNMQAEFFFRVCEILKLEDVKYDESVVAQVVQAYFPDNRRILNRLQQYARASNEIDTGILMDIEELSITGLVESIKNKKFKQIVQWCTDNKDNDTSIMYEKIYKELKNFVEPSSIPDAIMILEEGQRWDSTVPSKELHLASVAVELMTSLDFK